MSHTPSILSRATRLPRTSERGRCTLIVAYARGLRQCPSCRSWGPFPESLTFRCQYGRSPRSAHHGAPSRSRQQALHVLEPPIHSMACGSTSPTMKTSMGRAQQRGATVILDAGCPTCASPFRGNHCARSNSPYRLAHPARALDGSPLSRLRTSPSPRATTKASQSQLPPRARKKVRRLRDPGPPLMNIPIRSRPFVDEASSHSKLAAVRHSEGPRSLRKNLTCVWTLNIEYWVLKYWSLKLQDRRTYLYLSRRPVCIAVSLHFLVFTATTPHLH